MADDILKNIPLPADLPENWTSGQTVAPTGAEVGMDEQHGYNYLMKQVNNAQKALKALSAQREEDLAKIKFWISEDSTSPAELIGGTWEEIASECALMGRSSSHAAGSTVDAGLPNITGSAYGDVQQSGAPVYWSGSGAIQTSQDSGGSGIVMYKAADYGNHRSILKFNASKSNSIYGRSGTVQPAAYYVYIWRRIA